MKHVRALRPEALHVRVIVEERRDAAAAAVAGVFTSPSLPSPPSPSSAADEALHLVPVSVVEPPVDVGRGVRGAHASFHCTAPVRAARPGTLCSPHTRLRRRTRAKRGGSRPTAPSSRPSRRRTGAVIVPMFRPIVRFSPATCSVSAVIGLKGLTPSASLDPIRLLLSPPAQCASTANRATRFSSDPYASRTGQSFVSAASTMNGRRVVIVVLAHAKRSPSHVEKRSTRRSTCAT